ncbi:methylmalonyl Co-A mutase-associated GTPase MeaB [Bacillus kwashiorkori]|uniref:methylmalonyl Co-A mutase-associated GTPase MeaB n=1 Tax=Bacillus kwashiorkori TaxID=1522318 RepID=UPI0007845E07|nr:methylmalonyl Co-A mutase-associated GTPase MeaB [Bacillus kwashiorkori]
MTSSKWIKKTSPFSIVEYAEGLKRNDRAILAKAITLIESNHPNYVNQGQQLLKEILPNTGNSLRIGITGVPGAGKSSFIENLGTMLCNTGKKVAVLAIDPSSPLSSGSILGDKTRMEKLSRHPNAFIRPSPTGGSLGGVHRKTREAILLCEAAGFEIIIVETVGVGQSEVSISTMTDIVLLLAITGAGDDLQGIKKGILEIVDSIIVTKADGENLQKALETKSEYKQILRLLYPRTKGWKPQALACSSFTGYGIKEIWELILQFEKETKKSGVFLTRRQQQTKDWLKSTIFEQLEYSFFQNENVKSVWSEIEQGVIQGKLPVTQAANQLMKIYKNT